MKEKITVDLKGVPQTLLLPLLGRAKFSQKSYSPLHDQRAIDLVNSLDYDFNHLQKQVGETTLFWMARAYHFDEAIKHYLKIHPKAVIVNLGAGLETAFYRVDNRELTWLDLDLPEVIALRDKLLPPPPRVHYIAKSILDYSWIEEVKKYGKDVFFFAGGLFMYFSEEQVNSIFLQMANHFPQGELIFDAISKKGLYYANRMLSDVRMNNAKLKWGLDDGKELEKWSPNIILVSQKPYFQGIKTKFAFPLFLRMKMVFLDLFNKGGIIHLKFR
jgi:O-methyltransferase involved in polyketide biosynthesis